MPPASCTHRWPWWPMCFPGTAVPHGLHCVPALRCPGGGRGLREPTEPVSVADSLGPAPHREFEEGTALALMDPVLVCSGCPVSLPTRVTTFIVWCPMWEMVVCGGEGLHFVPAAVGSGGPGMGSLAAYNMKSRMELTWRGSHFWQYPVAAQ